MQDLIETLRPAAKARAMDFFKAVLAIGLSAAAWSGAAEAWPTKVGPFVYVGSFSSSTGIPDVLVLNTVTNSVVAAISLGGEATRGSSAVAPDGKRVYATTAARAYPYRGSVSVIDTTTSKVVATAPVGNDPTGIAIAPDGRRAYVANHSSNTVSVIDTATNTVVASIPGGKEGSPREVAVTPDGKRLYVSNDNFDNVSVIDTESRRVVATVRVLGTPIGIAITPDGKHAYVADYNGGTVSVIDTGTNEMVKLVFLANSPSESVSPVSVAVTPDGKRVYVTNYINGIDFSGKVSVIATASNVVVATIPLGRSPRRIAVAPDGKHAYVMPDYFGSCAQCISVIETATNKLVNVPIGSYPLDIGIVPAPPGLPFRDFEIAALDIHPSFGTLYSYFTLSSTDSNGVRPDVEPVKLTVGGLTARIPPGSFKKQPDGSFTFAGTIDGAQLNVAIKPAGALRYAFAVQASSPSLALIRNPVQVTLIIGDDAGLASVKADIELPAARSASIK